ncbi:MAG: hypothetical protein N2170_09145 [Bacteroidia bacterium]|nr:hypothetical protein [Bacteroidia bacterium]
MKKIAFLLVPLLGVALAKAEAPAVMTTSSAEIITSLGPGGPGKNYRVRMAQAYFGKRAGCRRGGFCGR